MSAQEAPAYYNSIDFDTTDDALKNQLTQLITNTQSQVTSYNELWSILKQSDRDPSNSADVLLMYGWDDNNVEDDDDYTRGKNETCGNGNPCTDETWNREHVFPRSLDLSNSNNQGPTADPHMLRSCDVEMNGLRANREFGIGSGIASYVTNSGDFFPGDNWKGDVARIIMFMYVRYGEDWNPNLVGEGANTFHADMPDIFLEWNAQDPVSQYEINRNNTVQGYQGNRNPFIDNPYLATQIWGGAAAENTWPDTLSTTNIEFTSVQVYPNPTKNTININGISANATIHVYNISGKHIQTLKKTTQIHLPQKGIYFILIDDQGKKYMQKVIKE